jgi:hypothetical protein
MVAGSARVEWLDADEAELVEIEPVDEHVDRAHGVVLGHVVVEHRRKRQEMAGFFAKSGGMRCFS